MNIKLPLIAVGAALLAVPVIAAPGGAGKADTDGNGVISRTEAQANAARMFARLDADKNGKIDAADRMAQTEQRQDRRFANLDADGNGNITKAEWDAHGDERAAKREQRRAARADAGDGERPQGMRAHRGKRGGHHAMGSHMLTRADSDGDQAISAAEFEAAALQRFDAADANKDGQLTAEERQAQRSAWRAQRGRAAPSSN